MNDFTNEGHNGLDANTLGISENNDFWFEYMDIPSYFKIRKDEVCFIIADEVDVEDVFDKNSFLKI